MSDNIKDNDYLYSVNSKFIAEMYNLYKNNPDSVSSEWKDFFTNLGDDAVESDGGIYDVLLDKNEAHVHEGSSDASDASVSSEDFLKLKLMHLAEMYVLYGHYLVDLDPLGIVKPIGSPYLTEALALVGKSDMGRSVNMNGYMGFDNVRVADFLSFLNQRYCGSIGYEIGHVANKIKRDWFASYIANSPYLATDAFANYTALMRAEEFEKFVHLNFPGAKRFSIEGNEAAAMCMELILKFGIQAGLQHVTIGMAHRGRLGVLTNLAGKPYSSVLSEFSGVSPYKKDSNVMGDVKYHAGYNGVFEDQNGKVKISVCANPSHLEAVDPVAIGSVRAMQDAAGEKNKMAMLLVLAHGDASFAGQGVVTEMLAMNELPGYTTNGAIHIITNNQLGFTANFNESRTAYQPSAVARSVDMPIIHVNGYDPDAVAFATRMALEYRMRFGSSVLLNIVGYRKYGHNEGDEPRFTQPLMYSVIDKKKSVADNYLAEKIAAGQIDSAAASKAVDDFKSLLQKELQKTHEGKVHFATDMLNAWKGMRICFDVSYETAGGVKDSVLKKYAKTLTKIPAGFSANSKVERVMRNRMAAVESGEGIDWGNGEMLAFASLLADGYDIRISGQDSCRGTFSHRHSVLKDAVTGDSYTALQNLSDKQGKFTVANSLLSEFAVMGFEYGYSTVNYKSVTIWEAQFGDFANGAQTIVDQFISAAETKWLQSSGLVLLLPHGYEGQGPEHSSARIERYLQLSAQYNWQVANCTTPANYFHILRRQVYRDFRKPLVLFTPKGLLRHKMAVSSLADMAEDKSFEHVIDDGRFAKGADKVRKIVFCSGRVYYDIMERVVDSPSAGSDVAIVRIEQIYPFPSDILSKIVRRYTNAKEFVWCQEEHRNMGCWSFVRDLIADSLSQAGFKNGAIKYVGRCDASSTATGYGQEYKEDQVIIVKECLS